MDPFIKSEKEISLAEYLAEEERSDVRHDFFHGEVYTMAGGTKNHNNIILNIGTELRQHKRAGCDVFIDGMKLEVEKDQFYVYPDLMYTCADDLKGDSLFVKYPSLIFEIISPATALYDKEVKLKYYKKIGSLGYYVLISQKEILAEVYSRIDDTQIWKYQTFENLGDEIHFERLGFVLSLQALYSDIIFEKI